MLCDSDLSAEWDHWDHISNYHVKRSLAVILYYTILYYTITMTNPNVGSKGKHQLFFSLQDFTQVQSILQDTLDVLSYLL